MVKYLLFVSVAFSSSAYAQQTKSSPDVYGTLDASSLKEVRTEKINDNIVKVEVFSSNEEGEHTPVVYEFDLENLKNNNDGNRLAFLKDNSSSSTIRYSSDDYKEFGFSNDPNFGNSGREMDGLQLLISAGEVITSQVLFYNVLSARTELATLAAGKLNMDRGVVALTTRPTQRVGVGFLRALAAIYLLVDGLSRLEYIFVDAGPAPFSAILDLSQDIF